MAAKSKREPKQMFDRVPPQNVEAERSVLGAMLLNPDAVGTAIEILHDRASETFYSEAHQLIYTAMLRMFSRNMPVDQVTLFTELKDAGELEAAGGPSYVAALADAVPTSANVEYYARIVLDAAILRRIITACTSLASEAYETQGEVIDLLDKAESEIFQIAEQRQLSPIERIGDLIPQAIEHIEQQIKQGSGISGIASGFHDLDNLLTGFKNSDMIVLAARPSVGKTALALNMAAQAAIHQNKSVLMFSLEMSKEQLTHRLLCMQGHINSRKLREGFLAKQEFPKLQRAADKLSRAPLYIDDTPNITALDLRSKARKHKAQHDVDFLIIDYLQLMSSGRRAENRQVEISEISRGIKGLGRELNVPVLALSQLSREAERDDTGAPKLSHLRESGAIEQDADVVMMLARPPDHEREGNENLISLNVAKHRNGPVGEVKLLFDKNTQHFGDLAKGFGGGAPPDTGPPVEEYGEESYEEAFEDDAPF